MSEHDHDHGSDRHDHGSAVSAQATRRVDVLIAGLERRGVTSEREIAESLERFLSAAGPATGAQVVARAWMDQGFKARLLANASMAIAELGIDLSHWAPVRLRAVENTRFVHNVIVCTLCSCYPIALLGPSPSWYKSEAYRSRVVREPRAMYASSAAPFPKTYGSTSGTVQRNSATSLCPNDPNGVPISMLRNSPHALPAMRSSASRSRHVRPHRLSGLRIGSGTDGSTGNGRRNLEPQHLMETSAMMTFTLHDVRAAFAADVFASGEAYAHDGHVHGVAISRGQNAITAHVSGNQSELYAVVVYISRTRSRTIITGFCDCPVSFDCKHIAATLIEVLNARTTPGGQTAINGDPTPAAAITQKQIPSGTITDDALVERWLSGLAASIPSAAAEALAGTERIAYVLGIDATSASRAFPVEIVVQRRTKAQRWTKLRDTTAESVASGTARAVAPDDAMVARFIQVYERTYGSRMTLADDIARRIVATGRAAIARPATPPLSLGPARAARIEWRLANDGTQRPTLVQNDPAMLVLPAPLFWYVDPETGVCGPLDAGVPTATLAALLDAPALSPKQAQRVRETFRGPIAELTLPVPIDIVERVARVQPVPVLRLHTIVIPAALVTRWDPGPAAPQTRDFAEFAFAYDDEIVDPDARGNEIRCLVNDESVTYVRAPQAEKRAMRRLVPFGFRNDVVARQHVAASGLLLCFEGEAEAHWAIFAHRSVAELRAEGWRVEIDPSFRHRIVDISADDVWHTHIEETVDGWFDLAIGVDIDGKRIDLLPLLRDLLASNGPLSDPAALDSVADDGSFYMKPHNTNIAIAFPAGRLKAIVRTLIELTDPDALRADGRLRLPRVRSAVVSELASASGLRWDMPERLRILGERLRAFSGVTRVDVPASFRGELRPYQRDGLDWLQFLSGYGFGGILADDMGLGKSVQTLAHLLCEKDAGRLTQPVLLVAPTSLVYNWCDESARFAPSLRVLALHGPARAAHFAEIAQHDLVITTYALLVRDTALRERTWHAVILDEAQALKNPQAKAAQVAMGLHCGHRLCLTGTPVENHLGDLWSLFSIALPGALGDRKQFGRVFRTPIEKRGDASRSKALARRVAPFLLRRTKEAVATELPEKTEIIQRVELTGAQRDLYETVRLAMHQRVRDEIAQRGIGRSHIIILDALLKLRQVCCDPRLLPKKMQKAAHSVKLELLHELLPQMIDEGRRILVFSQFTSMLDLIAPMLDERKIPFVVLTGRTTDRASVVKRFQSGSVPVFLISLKAGGTGLNLTAADTVIHYDPWWNPAVERQATDRAHRIGQTKHIFVYKLIAAGTVEEKIIELQARKAQLATAIFAENGGAAARFAAEDVERLFAPISDADTASFH